MKPRKIWAGLLTLSNCNYANTKNVSNQKLQVGIPHFTLCHSKAYCALEAWLAETCPGVIVRVIIIADDLAPPPSCLPHRSLTTHPYSQWIKTAVQTWKCKKSVPSLTEKSHGNTAAKRGMHFEAVISNSINLRLQASNVSRQETETFVAMLKHNSFPIS